MRSFGSPVDGLQGPFGKKKAGAASRPLVYARYWRVYITAVANGSGVTELKELKFNTAPGTRAPLTGVAIRSSANGGSVAANAFDDLTGTAAWTSVGSPPGEWIGYDYGAGYAPAIIEVQMYVSGGRAPRDFTIQYSDNGSTWFDYWSVYGMTYWPGTEYKTFKRAEGPTDNKRRWRIYITGTSNGGVSPEITELVFRRSDGNGAPYNGFPIKSSQNGASIVDRLFDGSTAAAWTAGGNVPQWAGYDYGVGENVFSVSITASGDTGRAPRDFEIQYADGDSATWNTALSQTGVTWTAGQTKTFNLP